MLAGDRPASGKLLDQFRMPGERTLIAAIVIAFLILHILAIAMLQRAADGDPGSDTRQEAASSLYD